MLERVGHPPESRLGRAGSWNRSPHARLHHSPYTGRPSWRNAMRLAALTAPLLAAAWPAAAQDGAPAYVLTLIDPAPGMDTNSPRAINEAGEISGVASPEPFHPLSLPLHVAADGTVTVLEVLDVAFNSAQGLNGQG